MIGAAMTFESSSVDHPSPESSTRLQGYLELFVISFVILFLELTCIRWFSSTAIFLTFFTNLVLMACFLGMSVGCLAASGKLDLIQTTSPFLLWTVLLSGASLLLYDQYGRIQVDVGGQGSPQQVFFGTEPKSKDASSFVVPVEAIGALFFALIAMIFVGPGQVMGRCLNRLPNRVLAYTVNVLGSLSGIALFGAMSYFRTSPFWWFAVATSPCIGFVKRSRGLHAVGSAGLLLLVALLSGYGTSTGGTKLFWSPYYKVTYFADEKRIATNNIEHQSMVSVAETAPAYSLPHLLNRDAENGPFDDVLIVGAGSGNDVQAALAHGAKHVDAIEIDPVMYQLGLKHHPDQPYAVDRVSVHIDDGRDFLRATQGRYDLVSYAVVDSLVLHSGYSSLRLESFLFTEEAFRDIKAKLKPGGVFAMYNVYRQGWVVGRLAKMAEKVFGAKPIVICLPYLAEITPQGSRSNHFTLLLVGDTNCAKTAAIRARFDSGGAFWLNERPKYNRSINGFGPEPPKLGTQEDQGWLKIAPASIDTRGIKWLPTDDWPYLYLREPAIPWLNLRWLLLISVISVAILYCFAPVRTLRPKGQMFFLGAGFMLLETKGVVQMALLFGSTWIVNSIIFFAILVMILFSNLFVAWARPQRLWGWYVLLIAALALSASVPLHHYLDLAGPARVVVSCAVVFAPIFLAGVIFATVFRDSLNPDIDLGSNIAGVILGGLSEYLSLMMGFNSLLMIAIGYYVLSAWLGSRRLPNSRSNPPSSGMRTWPRFERRRLA
jgi:SAM-dependent methyltransferase